MYIYIPRGRSLVVGWKSEIKRVGKRPTQAENGEIGEGVGLGGGEKCSGGGAAVTTFSFLAPYVRGRRGGAGKDEQVRAVAERKRTRCIGAILDSQFVLCSKCYISQMWDRRE